MSPITIRQREIRGMIYWAVIIALAFVLAWLAPDLAQAGRYDMHLGIGGSLYPDISYDTSGGPKPAYYTFEMLADKIGCFTTVVTLQAGDVRLYKFVSGDKVVPAAWVRTPQAVDVIPHLAGAEILVTHIVEDRSGGSKELAPV